MVEPGKIRTRKRRAEQHYFGVWGVSNYYHKLELQAESGAEINAGYLALIAAAGLLATCGLLADSPTAVIGAMCIAPFLGPSRSVCLSGLYLDRGTFIRALFKQLFGLLIVGASLGFVITLILKDAVPGIGLTSEILLRAMPTVKDAVLTVLIAIAAGAGSSLAFTADPHVVDQPWGQLLDVMIGVEIAISLLPPAAVIGIGLALEHPEVSRNALALLLVNLLALDVLGSMLIFLLRGIRRRHFDLERGIRQTVESALEALSGGAWDNSIIDVTLTREGAASVDVMIRGHTGETVSDRLSEELAKSILAITDWQSQVMVEVASSQQFSTVSPQA